jgi:hypothetical protein
LGQPEHEYNRVPGINLRIIGLLVFPLVAGLMMAAKAVIVIVYGQKFAGGWPVVSWMAFAVGIGALITSLGQVLLSRAKMWLFFGVNLLGAVVFIALAYLVVDRWGGCRPGYCICYLQRGTNCSHDGNAEFCSQGVGQRAGGQIAGVDDDPVRWGGRVRGCGPHDGWIGLVRAGRPSGSGRCSHVRF